MDTVNKKRFSAAEAEKEIFRAVDNYFDILEARTRDRSARAEGREALYHRASMELRECEARLREIAEIRPQMIEDLNTARLEVDHLRESEIQSDYADIQAERKSLEARAKEARAVVDSSNSRRYRNSDEVGTATLTELDRLSPLKGVDAFKRRLIAAVEDGRERVRGAIG